MSLQIWRYPIDFKGFLQEKGVSMRSYSFLILRFIAIILLLTGFGTTSHAQNVVNALKSADKGDWTQLNQLRRSTQNRAAKKTLDWFAYSRGTSNVGFQEIANFLNQNPDWPASNTLRRKAEERLTLNISDASFLKFTNKEKPSAANAMDRYVRILLAKGQTSEVQKTLNEWWPDANLTRDEQRKIYAAYGRYIYRSAHQKRFNSL